MKKLLGSSVSLRLFFVRGMNRWIPSSVVTLCNLNYLLPYRLLSSSPSKYILAKKSACTRTAPRDGQDEYSLTVQFQSQDVSASPLLPGIISIAMLFGSKWSRGGVLKMPNNIDRRLLCATRSPTEFEGKR